MLVGAAGHVFSPSFSAALWLIMLHRIAWANFDPWYFFKRAHKKKKNKKLFLRSSVLYFCVCIFFQVRCNDQSGPDRLDLIHQSRALAVKLPFCVKLFLYHLCVCKQSRAALQHCWQDSYLSHPRTRRHRHTFPFFLWIPSQSSLAPLFPTLGWAHILSALCKPAPLCHQDYRLCCSKLMTDISTLLSALQGTHGVTRTRQPVLRWREEQLRGR